MAATVLGTFRCRLPCTVTYRDHLTDLYSLRARVLRSETREVDQAQHRATTLVLDTDRGAEVRMPSQLPTSPSSTSSKSGLVLVQILLLVNGK